MKYEQEVRDILVRNTIHLIAEGGFEKATTKAITHRSEHLSPVKMNEVYIYRLFGDKEQLYGHVFETLDKELHHAFKKGIEAVGGVENLTKQTLYDFFLMAWNFILGNEEHCRCYIRYYYSIYFKGPSKETHRRVFAGMIAELTSLFKVEADVHAILHSVFTALFDFAIRVYNDDLEDSDINRPHIFNVLYCMMATYFKDTAKAETQNKKGKGYE